MKRCTLLKIGGGFVWASALAFLPIDSMAQNYKTLGPSSCGLGNANCHVKENNWWKDDNHSASVEPFYNPSGKYLKVANAYGVRTADLAKGSNGCMTCHATVISGKESKEVAYGVSCESCHGAAGPAGVGYLEPHAQKGGKQIGFAKGMVNNEILEVRAKTCVRCHYITERRLIDAGHPTGEDFDYVSEIKKVAKHWKHALEAAAEQQPAFAKAMSARGGATASRLAPTPTPSTGTSPTTTTRRIEVATTASQKKTALSLPLPPDQQKFKTLGPPSCGTDQVKCHVKEYQWWKDDDHYSSAVPFYTPSGKYVTYAQRAGLNPDDIDKGNQNCMKCHGTAISAKFPKEVDQGVSCESCHGAGSGYKDNHSQKGMRLAAIDSGLVDNFELSIMGDTCVRCHYITEQALLRIGHTEGWDSNSKYVIGIRQKISGHWQDNKDDPSDDRNARRVPDSLKVAFDNAIQSRGVVPIVEVLPPTPEIPIESFVEDNPPTEAVNLSLPPRKKVFEQKPANVESMPGSVMPVINTAPVELDSFPAVNDSMSVARLLLILKKRLEELYRKTGGN